MDTTKAQQIALDDALVAPANRLKIGKCNHRLSSTLKSNEPTLQVVLDVLKLTPFYKAFQITANVPEIYMQEFWATVSVHHTSLRFKMNDKSHTLNLENFKDMLQICPRLPGQKFEDPSLEEEILSFIRDLGHTGEIKVLTDVNVNHMHQPWKSFVAIINRCLSGKTTGSGYQQKDRKPSQNDKTEHGMEKTVQNQGQSPKMPKSESIQKNQQKIIDFLKASSVHYALTINPTIYTSCIEQFWATAKIKTVNDVRQIQALMDKKKLIITETSIRSDLHLEDA
ncbi:hypothetical protein Tco_1300987 [Tanacetum coccineum]